MLRVGFARIDITTPLGTNLSGYYEPRIADGILDPLLATAVVFDDGEHRGIVISCDIIGMNKVYANTVCDEIAAAIGTTRDGVYLACTHTHVGPEIYGITTVDENVTPEEILRDENARWIKKRLVDVACLAASDIAPAKLFFTKGEAKDVAFIRRFKMKDGTGRTNPGWQNPDIDHSIGTPDDVASLVIIKRENKKEIGIVHFQVHPDVVSGNKYTADFPKFVRDTYELNVPNSLCIYLNGTQGDTNHIDVRLNPEVDCAKGYTRSKYMGKKIAMSVISNYELAKPIDVDKVSFARRDVKIKYNKGTPEELPTAIQISKVYYEEGSEAAVPGVFGMQRTEIIAKATRIVSLMNYPDYTTLTLSALAVGDLVFGGFPGEPFTEIGRNFKSGTDFQIALPTCTTNGYTGYYPVQSAFDEGSYEALTSRFAAGTAEKLLDALIDTSNSLKKKQL